MPITKWDKPYLAVLILSFGIILSFHFLRGEMEAQKVAQVIFVPLISVLLLVGLGLQRLGRFNQNKQKQESETKQNTKNG